MSEFKFACPVCGQHITADSKAAGTQLECPTCYRKIVVPEGRSADSKLIISAAQADRPRPVSAETAADFTPIRPSSRKSIPAVVLLLVVACAAGGAVYVF